MRFCLGFLFLLLHFKNVFPLSMHPASFSSFLFLSASPPDFPHTPPVVVKYIEVKCTI